MNEFSFLFIEADRRNQKAVRFMMKQFEDIILQKAKAVKEGRAHGFSERGVQLLFQQYHLIVERREMEAKKVYRGTKE
jgi:hypothetical protein